MSISFNDVGSNLRRIMIDGRLDMAGTDSISAKLVELTAVAGKRIVVDLTGLRFLASIGISALITSAKAVQKHGGKLVLVVTPGSPVAMSLDATGVDELIPVFSTSSEAESAAVA
jgi:anti-anti-sigma factor